MKKLVWVLPLCLGWGLSSCTYDQCASVMSQTGANLAGSAINTALGGSGYNNGYGYTNGYYTNGYYTNGCYNNGYYNNTNAYNNAYTTAAVLSGLLGNSGCSNNCGYGNTYYYGGY